jgi:predicted short-subunit dehydrogenase-like oxidoreductase (DUF2520 family)
LSNIIRIAETSETNERISQLLSERAGCYFQVKEYTRKLLTNLLSLLQSFLLVGLSDVERALGLDQNNTMAYVEK